MHLSGKFWLFSLAVLVWSTSVTASCPESLQRFLTDDSKLYSDSIIRKPSVRFIKLGSDGFVTIRKFGDSWYSGYEFTEGTMTFQGDPRDIVYVLGSKLAFKLGIRINEVESGQIEMRLPGANKFHEILVEVNKNLKAKGREPITYHPTKAGFVDPRDTLDLALSAKEDFLLNFPYDDNNPYLTVHDISYHLGALVLSKKITERTRLLNKRIQQMIDYLKEHRENLKDVDLLIEKILEQRSLELDAGTGNLSVSLSTIKSFYNHDSYSKISKYINSSYFLQLNSAINHLIQSDKTPLKAAISKMMDVRISQYDGLDWARLSIQLDGFYKKYKNEELFENIPVSNTGVWTREFLSGLDSRLEAIYEALP